MTPRWQPPSPIRQRFDHLLALAREATEQGDIEQAWEFLADAHIVTQPWALPHVQAHYAMLMLGFRTGSPQEVLGQLARIVLAAPGSLSGRYPVGNSGRANVSAFAPAPLRSDLADLLSKAQSAATEAQDTQLHDIRIQGTDVRDAEGVRRLYDRIAPLYDMAAAPYWMLGADKLSDEAIAELRLQPGSTVVELGTGTGRNLAALSKAVGPSGRVIGVDLSSKMLQRAKKKLTRSQIRNVVLISEDMTTYEPPPDTAGVLSTYAIEMLPDSTALIQRLSNNLPPGARIAVSGLRRSSAWPEVATRIGSLLMRPFGVTPAYRSHQPWLVIESLLEDTVYREAVGGVLYLAAGTARSGDSSHKSSDEETITKPKAEPSNDG